MDPNKRLKNELRDLLELFLEKPTQHRLNETVLMMNYLMNRVGRQEQEEELEEVADGDLVDG